MMRLGMNLSAIAKALSYDLKTIRRAAARNGRHPYRARGNK